MRQGGRRIRVALACDHAGFPLKEPIAAAVREAGHETVDCGCAGLEPVDYLEYTLAAVEHLADGRCERAIFLCGNGYAMAMAANRFPGVRAAVCHDSFSARTVVEMGAANALSLGSRVVGEELALELVRIWLRSEFRGDVDRYARRLARLEALERELAAPDWRKILACYAAPTRDP